MRKHRLLILFVAALICVTLSVLVQSTSLLLSVSVLTAGLGLLIYVAVRVARFSRRLRGFLKLLLVGNYEVGMTTSVTRADEVSDLDRHLEKLAEQLRTYDALRASRVQQCQRSLDLITEHTVQPMIILDVEKETLESNPAMRLLLDITTQTVSLKAIEKIPTNKDFMAMIHRAVDSEKTVQEGLIHVQFPAKDSQKRMLIRMLPLKDRGEVVHSLIMLNMNEDALLSERGDPNADV